MNIEAFRKHAHELVDWMADYLENIESYPVKSQLLPQDVIKQLPEQAPVDPESFETIMADFQTIIMPGITHWQHPSFHAYFPGNSSLPSLLAEMITATLSAQCMIWQTSPAAAELEERVMEWLAAMLGLPEGFTGVIQDTASSATLCAILSARESKTDFRINEEGFSPAKKLITYCSEQTHSSIDKAVKIAGIGKSNLRKIAVDDAYAMNPLKLESQILADLKKGYQPLCVIATIGTTGSTAIDPLKTIAEICQKYQVWLHIDAAFAGTALLLPEMRWMIAGMEMADSFVFNPHKWMFTNFDCSAYYVKDPRILIRTFDIMPEYLKTAEDEKVNNYRDWGIALGRRFRALKLWFVIRSFGVDGLQKLVRKHIRLAKELADKITDDSSFELLAPVPLNTLCLRFHPPGLSEALLNELNARLLEHVNNTGKAYLTHTKLNGRYTIRLVIGQTNVEKHHVDRVWKLLQETAKSVL